MKKRLLMAVIIMSAFFLMSFSLSGCKKNEVVIYTSADQNFAEPVLKAFEEKTGIKVKAVFDVEAQKTTGLVNRLIAEKNRPLCDVFWSGEVAQTIKLKYEGVLQKYIPTTIEKLPAAYYDDEGFWSGFGGRARVFLVNTKLVSEQDYPSSIYDLANDKYDSSSLGMAMPLFGTTNTHAAALYSFWGEEKAFSFFKDVKERGVKILDGNGVVRDEVVNGTIKIGLTDTDDAMTAVKNGESVKIILPDQDSFGTLVIPNTVALVKGAPNIENAKKLIDFLAGYEAERMLLDSGFCEVPAHPINNGYGSGLVIKEMEVDFEDMYSFLERANKNLTEVYVR